MPKQWIVQTSAILGQPNTDRTFLQGEVVNEEDFARCTVLLAMLLKRGSLVEASDKEAKAGEEVRVKNDAAHLGFPSGAPRVEVLAALKERRDLLNADAGLPVETKVAPAAAPPVQSAAVIDAAGTISAAPSPPVHAMEEPAARVRRSDR